MRVSSTMIFNQSVYNLNQRQETFFDLNEKVSTGKRVNRPSDDPIDAGRILGYRTLLDSIAQYQRNIDNGVTWLTYTESSLGDAERVFNDAKVLAEQMATGSYTAEQRDMLVGQAEQLFEHLMQVGNTKVVDRYIFSGFKTDSQTFTRDNNFNVQYHGDNSKIKITVKQNVNFAVNTTGQRAFLDGKNLFNILRDLRNALETNDQEAIGDILPEIDEALTQLSKERAAVGTSMNEMEATKFILEEFSLATEALLSTTEDTDMIEAVTDLSTHEVAFEAALKSTSLITSLSLVNYV
ncbi:flagellar hook-associated protein FlgL [Thermodesulfobacteriota bacterium]